MANYPPIIASSMPVFDINSDSSLIYYTISPYDSINFNSTDKLLVSIRRQSSNVSIFREEKTKAYQEYRRTLIIRDKENLSLNRYYVDLKSFFNSSNPFLADVLYKVQLRFYTPNLIIQKRTEWSTVCIIKYINKPTFYIDNFYLSGKDTSGEDNENQFSSLLPDFVAAYKQLDSEPLKTWRIRLLSNEYSQLKDYLNINNFTLADSGLNLINASNYLTLSNLQDVLMLPCSLPYELKNELSYKLLYEILTRNGYTDKKIYNFVCNNINMSTLPESSIAIFTNELLGYIKVHYLTKNKLIIPQGNLVLRRTDSKSNFTIWKDLKYFESTGSTKDYQFTYYDFTALSGLFYRYLIQRVDIRGRRGTPVYDFTQNTNNPSGNMAEWEHAFLLESTGNGDIKKVKQLKLKYDFEISSYKTNISESKTDTIGSKYPFIRRNGNMYYRSFPISGTITLFMDLASLLTNTTELFNGYYDKYKEFKGLILNYVQKNDYTYERKFREKVELFLYNAKPKLYKSMQEGNIFIKLMLITLTPKNELGRLVYSFSATAYEIDKANILTYDNYGLIHIGTFNPNISSDKTIMAQITSYDNQGNINGNLFKANLDIMGAGSNPAKNSIAKYLHYKESINDTVVDQFSINWLRLIMESNPYPIIYNEEEKKYEVFNDIDKSTVSSFGEELNIFYQIEKKYANKDIYLGWLFTINNEQIIIAHPNYIYELKEDWFSFDSSVSIIPAKDTAMLVDFRADIKRIEDISKIPKFISTRNVNGQLIGPFYCGMDLFSAIQKKYLYNYKLGEERVLQRILGVHSILIDTDPGTKVYIKTNVMETPQEFEINENGLLQIDVSEIFSPTANEIYIDSIIFGSLLQQNSSLIINALVFYYLTIKENRY